MSKFVVTAIGRAFTDVFVSPSGDNQALQGVDIPPDGVCQVPAERLSALMEWVDSGQLVSGGAAANTAAIVAALGEKSGYFGKVAYDRVGHNFVKEWNDAGIELCCNPYDSQSPRSAICLVLTTPDGKRSFIVDKGCADNFLPKDFAGFDFTNTHSLMLESYLFYSDTAAGLMKDVVACAKGKTKIVATLTCTDWQGHEDAARFVVENADIIIGNCAEFQNFVMAHQRNLPPTTLAVMTDGEKGASARLNGGVYAIDALPPRSFVNSAGAGDGFAAGFLYALSAGKSVSNCLIAGTRVASMMLGEPSGRPTRSRFAGLRL